MHKHERLFRQARVEERETAAALSEARLELRQRSNRVNRLVAAWKPRCRGISRTDSGGEKKSDGIFQIVENASIYSAKVEGGMM